MLMGFVGGLSVRLNLSMSHAESVRFMKRSSLVLNILVLQALLIPLVNWSVACTALQPSHETINRHSVSLMMNASTLPQEVLDRMKNLRIRVFSLTAAGRGQQDGADSLFSLSGFTGEREFKIEGIQLGNKELVVDVLDGTNGIIGTGSLKLLVQPGLNLVQEKLVIKLIPAEQAIRNLPVDVTVGATGTNAVTAWGDVKALFTSTPPYRCAGCHSSDPDSNSGLDLSSFPFKSDNSSDQKEIVSGIISRVKGEGGFMPPGNGQKMGQSEVTLLSRWLDGGLQQGGSSPQLTLAKLVLKWECGVEKGEVLLTPKPGEANRYITELKSLKVGEKIKFKLKAMGIDDVVLGEAENNEGWIVDLSSPLKVNLTVNTATPSVAVQIEIVP